MDRPNIKIYIDSYKCFKNSVKKLIFQINFPFQTPLHVTWPLWRQMVQNYADQSTWRYSMAMHTSDVMHCLLSRDISYIFLHLKNNSLTISNYCFYDEKLRSAVNIHRTYCPAAATQIRKADPTWSGDEQERSEDFNTVNIPTSHF